MRNAFSFALCFLFSTVLPAQGLWSGWETAAGSSPGRPGLQSPLLKSFPIPETQFRRRPGLRPDTVDWLCSIEPDGRVKPVSIVHSLETKSGGQDDQAKAILARWTFQPGVLNGRPARVGVVLSVPFGEGRPIKTVSGDTRELREFSQGLRGVDEPGVVAPIRIMGMAPAYPDDGRMRRQQGDVKLATVVEANGRVGRVLILQSAGREADEAAVIAVKEWLYLPGLADGVPVATFVVHTIAFRLR